MKEQTFDVYEYPIKGANGNVYLGSYTIIAGLKPCGFKGEKKVDTFIATVKAQSLIHIQLHSQGKSLVFCCPDQVKYPPVLKEVISSGSSSSKFSDKNKK